MNELSKQILECQKCPNYKDMPCGPVLGFGNSKIMVIGECPGKDEALIGQPFIGMCGKFFDKAILANANIERDQLYITNIQKCSEREGKKNVPAKQIPTCINWLSKEIDILKPKLIITLGKLPAINLLKLKKSTSLGSIIGKVHKYNSIDVIPAYHPSYCMMYNKGTEETIDVFKRIKEYL